MASKRNQSANPRSRSKGPSEGNELRSLKPYLQKYKFNMKELIMLKKRYAKMSINGILDEGSFREALGLLGLEQAAFLCNRIFEVIDEDGNGSANFDEFLQYMNTLIYGEPQEKAKQSFRMLDVFKTGKVRLQDIEAMIRGVSQLWNSLTGSRVKASNEYITKIFRTFDCDKDGVISFEDYDKVHDLSSDIFGWFEFFNQEEELLNQHSRLNHAKDTGNSSQNHFQKSYERELNEQREHFHKQIKFMEEGLAGVLDIVKFEQQKSRIEISQNSRAESFISNMSNLQNDFDLEASKSFQNKPSPSQQSSSTRGLSLKPIEVQNKTRSTNSTIIEGLASNFANSKRNFALGGPAFFQEPMSGKDPNDEDDIVFSPSSDDMSSPSNKRSLSPLILAHDNSTSQFPFDYNRERSREDTMDLTRESSQSFVEITDKLSKLQECIGAFKSHIKPIDTSISMKKGDSPDKPGSGQSPVIGGLSSEEKKGSEYHFDDTSGVSDTELTPVPHEMRPKRKTLQTRAEGPKNTERRMTMRNIELSDRRKNISVFFGHENWNLVLNMMIGLRTSIKSIEPRNFNEKLNDNEFKLKSRYEIIQKRTAGFDIRKACRFYDYFPHVFEEIRRQFGVSNRDFLKSCGPETLLGNLIIGNMSSLTELSSTGKSGSFFYFSEDGKYMLKTIPKREFVSLKRIIKDYHHHLMNHEQTLLARVFGLYKMKFYKTKTTHMSIYFIVMGNLFSSDMPIDVRYDLKGSTHGRTAKKKGVLPDLMVARKDLDFNEENIMIDIPPEDKAMLQAQLEADSKFCGLAKVIDYSLLLGIHYIKSGESYAEPPVSTNTQLSTNGLGHTQSLKTPNFNANGITFPTTSTPQQNPTIGNPLVMSQTPYNGNNLQGLNSQQAPQMTLSTPQSHPWQSTPSNGQMPNNLSVHVPQNFSHTQHSSQMQQKTVNHSSLLQPADDTSLPIKPPRFYERHHGGILSSDKKKIYVMGIIDMLTEYTTKKRMETVVKKTMYGKGISCIPPPAYAERFKNYVFSKLA